MIDDFGITPLAHSRPFVFDASQVRGGWSIAFLSPLSNWDEFVARQLREEAIDTAVDPATATADALRARREARIKRLAPRVAVLSMGDVDRTADAPAFLAKLAELRPDVFDAVFVYAYSSDAYRTEDAPPVEAIDAEPIAGNL